MKIVYTEYSILQKYKMSYYKEQHIDINEVLKKAKGGKSDSIVADIEDPSGQLTTITEAFADDDVIRYYLYRIVLISVIN